MGKVVSVDITAIGDPNSYWSGCYDRKGLAEHVDYAVLMGYDQTSGGSDRAGPVSSYNWLERILPPLLEEIPAERLILGLPFYTRVWTGDDGRASSDVLTLEYTEDFARRHKIMPRWQDTERQFYADWRENGMRKRVWLEEDRSLAEKAGLVKNTDWEALPSGVTVLNRRMCTAHWIRCCNEWSTRAKTASGWTVSGLTLCGAHIIMETDILKNHREIGSGRDS